MNFNENFCVVQKEELHREQKEKLALKQQCKSMQEDMIQLVDCLDVMIDQYDEAVHLLDTMEGIFSRLGDLLSVHSQRIFKGLLKKMKSRVGYIADLCNETEEKVELMSAKYDFVQEELCADPEEAFFALDPDEL